MSKQIWSETDDVDANVNLLESNADRTFKKLRQTNGLQMSLCVFKRAELLFLHQQVAKSCWYLMI